MNAFREWIAENFGERTRFDEPMRRHTSLRVGGAADIFFRPETTGELLAVVKRAKSSGVPVTVMGGGTNLLVADSGIRGVTLCLCRLKETPEVSETCGGEFLVSVSAGIGTPSFCRFAIENGLSGMNFALGIPGTLGGALRMNAGTAAGEMSDRLESLLVLSDSGQVVRMDRKKLRFGYRRMDLRKADTGDDKAGFPIILGARFLLMAGNKGELAKEADGILGTRKRCQPTALPSAGCFFRNPKDADSAGMLIDRSGMKGATSGGAMVSDRHANFIVNSGAATAADILDLTDEVTRRVFDRFAVQLEAEVTIVGS